MSQKLRPVFQDVTSVIGSNHEKWTKKSFLVGVDHIVNMYTLSTFIAAEYLGKPVAFEALDEILLANKNVTLDELKIDQEMPICGQTLLEANFDALNLILIGIVQNNTVNLFPLLAYQKIYQDFFRWSQWENANPSSYNVDYFTGTSPLLTLLS